MSEGSVYCPHCEVLNEITFDDYEGSEEFDFECRHCGKEFEVTVEYDPVFYGSIIKYEKCRCCGEKYRYDGQKYPKPSKFEHLNKEEYKICNKCYFKHIREDFK